MAAKDRHRCYDELDGKLVESNTRLTRNLFDSNQLLVATERIKNLRDGKRATLVVAAYCPFCGKKVLK